MKKPLSLLCLCLAFFLLMTQNLAPVQKAAADSLPDLIVTQIGWSPSSLQQGNAVVFSAKVTNQGSGSTPAGTVVGCQFQVDGQEVSWSDTDTAPLAPGESVTLTANNGPSGSASWTAQNGSHTVQAWVNDVNRFAESSTDNNRLSTALSITDSHTDSLADLIVTGIQSSPASPTAGNAVVFQATVQNRGTAATPAGAIVGCQFQVDGTLVSWSDTDTAPLAPGESVTLTANNGPSGSASWTAQNGSHTVQAWVNDVNRFAESSTDNNRLSTTLSITDSHTDSLPDLIVTGIQSSPASPTAGNAVVFQATVQNRGTAATPADAVVGCQFQVDGTLVSWSDTDTAPLAPGESVTLTANNGPSGSASWTAQNGSHTVQAWVNDVNRFAESSTDNNKSTISLTVTSAPAADFVVSGLTVSPASQQIGLPVTLTAIIYNRGNAAAAPGKTAFLIDQTVVNITAEDTSPLAAGDSRTVSFTWTAQTEGTHSASATVNYGNLSAESDFANNTASASVQVTPQPGVDFVVDSLKTQPAQLTDGSSVTFQAILRNKGTVAGVPGTVTFTVDGTQVFSTVCDTEVPAGGSVTVSAATAWTASSGTHSVTATVNAAHSTTETAYDNNSLSQSVLVAGDSAGAAMPYTDYLAADGEYGNGAVLHTDSASAHDAIAAEATNQRYVGLPVYGSYVQWQMTTAGAGVDLRFTIPDSADGMGQSGSLDCYVNGTYVKTIQLSSYWAYQYFTSGDPSDTPNGGTAAFQFDEVHWVLPQALKPGDVLKLVKTNGDQLAYGVDFVEVEPVAPAIAQPAGSLSVTQFGAAADDGKDDLAAFNACVNACTAQGKTMYIPAGTFDLSSMWIIGSLSDPIRSITITGAGIWYTNLQFTSANQAGGGISLRLAPTGKIDFSNIYLNSRLRSRYYEQAVYKCFMDDFGQDSVIHDIWEDHFECGFWIADYAHNPVQVATGLTIQNCRIRNNLADGVNFCNGTSNSSVINCDIRNCGDDGLAMWPNNYYSAPNEIGNTFAYDTVEHIWRSSGIAIYGGSGHRVHDCRITDTFMSAGIKMNTTFSGYHFADNTGIVWSNLTLIHTGTSCDCWQGEEGAVELEATTDAISHVTFQNLNILHTQRDAIQMGWSGGFNQIVFDTCAIDGTGEDGVASSKYSLQHLGGWLFVFTGDGSSTFHDIQTAHLANPNGQLVQQGFSIVQTN